MYTHTHTHTHVCMYISRTAKEEAYQGPLDTSLALSLPSYDGDMKRLSAHIDYRGERTLLLACTHTHAGYVHSAAHQERASAVSLSLSLSLSHGAKVSSASSERYVSAAQGPRAKERKGKPKRERWTESERVLIPRPNEIRFTTDRIRVYLSERAGETTKKRSLSPSARVRYRT